MNKKIMVVVILCLLFLCMKYTYSVFSNKIVGTINATNNVWNFRASVTGGDTFKDGYKLYLSGTSGSFDVVLDNTNNSESSSYSIELISDNLSNNVKFYTDSNYTNEVLNNIYTGNIYNGNSSTVTLYYKSDNTINDNILVKISSRVSEFYAMMKNGSNVTYKNENSSILNGTEFWNETYRLGIKTITFDNNLSNLPSSCTGDSDLCWDISYDSDQEKKVYGYLIDTGEDYTDSKSVTRDLYNLYIVSEVPIYAPIDSSDIFKYFKVCTTINFNDNFNTSKVTDMGYMFDGCNELTSLDLSNFNTSKVTNMYAMFYGFKYITNLDLSSFNTSKVTNMGRMFSNCTALTNLNLSNFDTSNVSNMGYMFCYCPSLTSLGASNFDTSNVTDMNGMFSGCLKLTSLNVSNFNTSNVTSMRQMFYGCSSLTSLNLSNFNTSKVTDMNGMFDGCSKLTSLDLSNFNTSKVTDMDYMFYGCSSLTSLDLSSFNTSKVTGMQGMFYRCSSLTTTINIMSVGVTNYSDMFYAAATNAGTQITVNYIADASTLVDNMIATKSSTSNVVKGSQI